MMQTLLMGALMGAIIVMLGAVLMVLYEWATGDAPHFTRTFAWVFAVLVICYVLGSIGKRWLL